METLIFTHPPCTNAGLGFRPEVELMETRPKIVYGFAGSATLGFRPEVELMETIGYGKKAVSVFEKLGFRPEVELMETNLNGTNFSTVVRIFLASARKSN